MIIVVSKSTSKNDAGEILSKVEVFKDDIKEDVFFTLPGFESRPLDGDNVLMEALTGGDKAVFMVALKSDLKVGERRIYATDSSGVVKSEILMLEDGTVQQKNDKISVTIDPNGKIEIKNLTSDDLIKLVNDLSANLQSAVTDLISATVPTALGPQSLSVAIPWAIPVTGLLAKTVENATKIGLYKK